MSDLTADDQPPPTARAELALLQALCQELTRQGRPANLVHCWLHDEFDVRLVTTGAADGGPHVDLLGPYDAARPTARWCAVQVCADDRLVWAGPPRSCAPVELLRFIDDLQQSRAPDRTADYERLG